MNQHPPVDLDRLFDRHPDLHAFAARLQAELYGFPRSVNLDDAPFLNFESFEVGRPPSYSRIF